MSGTLFIPLPGNDAMARRLAQLTQGDVGWLQMHNFPDGETCLALPCDVRGRDIALVSTLDHPDGKFLPAAFAARTARELGAAKVGLVAPYLCYMRQDKRFHPGEAVTSRIFASLISQNFDWLVTLDPHLHRYKALGEIYCIPARVAHAAGVIGKWIKQHVERPFLIGPDEESIQWVSQVAHASGADYVVLNKQRLGDQDVRITAQGLDRVGVATPVLVDDIIASGATILQAINILKSENLRSPVVITVHGLFAGDAARLIEEKGALLISTNSVTHATNCIDIAEPLAAEISALLLGTISEIPTEA